jgi:hypothetical protein
MLVGYVMLAGIAVAQSPRARLLPHRADTRGCLVSSQFIRSASQQEIAQFLTALGWTDVVVKSGVAIRRLVYTTIDAHGAPTTASGLLATPTDVEPVGVVLFAHGTSTQKSYVPSAPTGEGEGVAALFASGGFVMAAPDYLGMGVSPGLQPYLDAAAEASASLDLLTAAQQATRGLNVDLSHRLYLTGFSQGGQAALAVDRAVEDNANSVWDVVGVAPIAGPYDLSGTEFPGLVDGSSPSRSAYLAYVTLSFVRIYGGNLADIFQAPYELKVPALFSGQVSLSQIARALPPPRELFRREFLSAVLAGTDPFVWQLRENDTVLVVTNAPVRLYYGDADTDVLPENTQVAAFAMKSLGVKVEAVDLGAGVDHPASENLGLPAVRAWFDQLVDASSSQE